MQNIRKSLEISKQWDGGATGHSAPPRSFNWTTCPQEPGPMVLPHQRVTDPHVCVFSTKIYMPESADLLKQSVKKSAEKRPLERFA